MNRLPTIVKAFNKLTIEERLELRNWLSNTLSKEIKEDAIERGTSKEIKTRNIQGY